MLSISSIELSKRYSYLLFIFILLVACGIYSSSLSVPFYLDDSGSIVENSVLHSGDISELWKYYGLRAGGYFTFYVNYAIDGLEPMGFHLTNVAIHVINGVIVYFLCRSLITFVNRRNIYQIEAKNVTSLAITSIWLLHPLNSQSVIYVVQRLSELSALGFFLTALGYFQFRNSRGFNRLVWSLVICTGIAAGIGSKQNYFTVFPFILAIEYIFANKETQKRFNWTVVYAILIFAILVPFIGEFLSALDYKTRENHAISRSDYFYSQLPILFIYIRKFFAPYDIQLFMQVERYSELTWSVVAALIGHCLLIITAYRARMKFPLLTVGVALFYCGHLVESSIVPITDYAFEHRNYVPSLGLCFALCGLISMLIHTQKISVKNTRIFFVSLVMLLSAFTGIRVVQWQDPFLFFEREVALSPKSALANHGFGYQLMKKQEFEKAETYLANAYNYKLQNNQISVSSLNLYMTALFQLGKYSKANQVASNALRYLRYASHRSQILGNMSFGYIKMGMCDFALNIAKRAIDLDPSNQAAKNNYQYCLQVLSAEHHK